MILRVFIVEDEEMIRKGLVHTINWAGMGCLVVGSAADGRSGLSSILQKRPDVVITDIRMPEMDGLETRIGRVFLSHHPADELRRF